ncbi:hypothetical protein [Lachnospira pectinoschiza]|uniref:Uncharacterized protein n=1 Tax=Lachnospira pectinoschiza TaxID=28052 RepID=A0A1G9XNV9_9FIRM|nr:hypothetical protein [Lachnospira pectinoschiza]SDM98559.1 hypothetical protein SAMN05216544_1584 [Lachnospira pectinoschiza]
MNNETMLSSLVRGALNNENSREEFLKKMYDDVYALVYPVMKNKNDSKDYTEDALDYVYDNLSQINLNKNIYRQIATLVSSFLVKDLLEEANDYELKDCAYSYDNLKEDKELHNVCKNNVTAFRNVKDFKGCGKKFKKLPAVLMAMLELFGYEMRSVAEIAKLTNLSEDKVRGFLNEIRRYYGYEILDGFKAKAVSEDTNELDGFEFIDENTNPETAPIPEVEAITEDSEEDLELETLSVEADDDFEVDKSETDGEEKEEKKAGPIVGFFARLFPDLSVGQARIVTVALFGLVVAVVAVLVFVPLLGKDEVASDQVQVESTTEAESETETSEATTASQTKAATTKATTESTTEATKSSNSTTTSSTETTTETTEATSSNDSQDSKKSQDSNDSQDVEESGEESGEESSDDSTQKTDDNTEANATKATQEATTEAVSN